MSLLSGILIPEIQARINNICGGKIGSFRVLSRDTPCSTFLALFSPFSSTSHSYFSFIRSEPLISQCENLGHGHVVTQFVVFRNTHSWALMGWRFVCCCLRGSWFFMIYSHSYHHLITRIQRILEVQVYSCPTQLVIYHTLYHHLDQ